LLTEIDSCHSVAHLTKASIACCSCTTCISFRIWTYNFTSSYLLVILVRATVRADRQAAEAGARSERQLTD